MFSAAQSKIRRADVAGVEASQHLHLRSKNYPEKKKRIFLQLAVLHLSAFQSNDGSLFCPLTLWRRAPPRLSSVTISVTISVNFCEFTLKSLQPLEIPVSNSV